jgi:hypothetical protein
LISDVTAAIYNFANSGFSILVSRFRISQSFYCLVDIVSSSFPPQISDNFLQEGSIHPFYAISIVEKPIIAASCNNQSSMEKTAQSGIRVFVHMIIGEDQSEEAEI